MLKKLITITVLLFGCISLCAQTMVLSGKITDKKDGQPVSYASVVLEENKLWATTGDDGSFFISRVPYGEFTLTVQCLGYVGKSQKIIVSAATKPFNIALEADNLTLEQVEVVARRDEERANTTSYLIDRNAIDHRQTLNLTDISALLPGGKTVNSTLIEDDRLALRSDAAEKGNASFGTAIEVDGVRLDNNAMMDETAGASTRNLSSSDIESVEVVTGIPSVEYGDLSNGVVKINVRKGKSPLIVESSVNPHSKSISVSKGLQAGSGILNVSAGHAKSLSNLVSPHTAYKRNTLSLRYTNTLFRKKSPLTIEAGLSGNIGGYNSSSDPDEMLDSYERVRDNAIRGNISLKWLAARKWLTNLSFSGSFSYQDKLTETYKNSSSASSQPYIHTMEEGYFIAEDYESNPNANIILGPTGYWYVRSYNDQKPISINLKIKGELNKQFGKVHSQFSLGAQLSSSGNGGRGLYYENPRLAPTWREYRYDELPWMNNLALFAEEKMEAPLWEGASAKLTAGLRDDITIIGGSEYGNVSSLSPRANLSISFWKDRKNSLIEALGARAGWGRSFKLPSFQVLYPAPNYSDILAFTPGSTADNKAYYAYHTYPSQAIRNPGLKWQYTDQIDLGLEMTVKGGSKISVSGFYNQTYRPYVSVYKYTPYTYRYTGQNEIEGCGIASVDRRYEIDQATGQVTVFDRTGVHEPVQLVGTTRNSYVSNRTFINGSKVKRYGIEWIIDFARIKPLRTQIRVDGKYYAYSGVDQTLFAYNYGGSVSNGGSYPLMAYYKGGSSTSAGTVATAGTSNGTESRQMNLNATITTHIPKIRLIVSMRVESTLYWYKRSLNRLSDGEVRAYAIANREDSFGVPYKESMRNTFVAIYPAYYSTWDKPDELIPFAEKFAWARDNDQQLFNNLSRMVVRTNYAYVLNPNTLSAWFSANLSVTKEIGDHVSVSFYANNFFNNMGRVKSSQTGLKSSLFGSSYIPKFYYGLSLKIKL